MIEQYENLEFTMVKEAVAMNCAFSLGKAYVLNELPHFNYLWIERELQRGKEALALYEVYQNPNFAGVKDISDILLMIEKGGLITTQEIYAIASFSRACLTIKKYMHASELKTPAIYDLIDSLSEHKDIIKRIEECISNAYEIKDSASSTLKGIRRSISLCESEIVKTTHEIIAKYASSLMENITAMRNNRTCVLVKVSDKNKIKGFIHGESASGQAVYIEPESLLRLNNQLQSLKSNEEEEIERIIQELCTMIMPYVNEYLKDLDTLSLLDALFAKAKWAFDRCGVYAKLNNQEVKLYFKDARHPLIDESKVVANTYSLQEPYHHLLVTGSNTGGKTVTLKTIGLFTILTLSGFPILCEEAEVYCFDHVYVDIGDSQSIVASLSTFSAHLSNLATICNQATPKSLVLLDELGSGTDPNEGECLAIATLDYFREHSIMCIATTHYSKLKEYAKKSEDVLLASVAFDITKMEPTYRYLEGISGTSNALEIAQRYHLHDDIITKANALKEAGKSDISKLLEKLDIDRLALKEREESLNSLELQLTEQQKALEKVKESFKGQQEQILAKAKEQASSMIENAKEEAEEVIAQLKSLRHGVKEHEITALKSKLNQKEKDEVEGLPVAFMVGDYVRFKKLGYHGEIIAMKGNRATVFANGMKLNVKCAEIEMTTRPKQGYVASHASKSGKTQRVKMECNLIGMRVEEALRVVDKYLDDAMFSKLYQVRIIHGAGTGALRKAIHEYLKKHPYVDTFRLGQEGEGGLGATVVALKKGGKHG